MRLSLNATALGRPEKYQQAVLAALVGFKGSRVEIDLGALPFIDSAFCSWMIQISQQIQPARVVVVNAGARVQDILKHLGMGKVIDVR
jgi:anti-anti-sigma regulatory factor